MVVLAVLCAGITAPSSPGELSVQPQSLVGVAASPSPHVISKTLWQRALFLPRVHGPLIATDSEAAYFSSNNSVCAVTLRDGGQHWCTGSPSSSIAIAGSTVATVESDGAIRGRDKKTGSLRWERVLTPSTDPTKPQPSESAPPIEVAWSTGHSFLAARTTGSGPTLGATIAELSLDGSVLWSWSGEGVVDRSQPLVSSPYAVVNRVTSGAVTTSQPLLLKLGIGGGVLGSLASGTDPIEVRQPKIYSQVTGPREIDSTGLGFDVSVGDVQPGVADVDWHYVPDEGENSRLPFSGSSCCGSMRKRVGIESQYVYGAVGERVYRYDLAAPDGQRPILVSDVGTFVAGPYEKRVYVGRPDGVWAIHFNGRYVYQMLVVPYRLPTVLSAIAFIGAVGYAATTDGHVIAFRLDSGEPLIRARVACSAFAGIVVSQSRVLYACEAPTPTVFAFSR